MPKEVTVIIPTLNEGESIGATIESIPSNVPGMNIGVLVIDGNSTDNTVEEAERRGARVIAPAHRKARMRLIHTIIDPASSPPQRKRVRYIIRRG